MITVTEVTSSGYKQEFQNAHRLAQELLHGTTGFVEVEGNLITAEILEFIGKSALDISGGSVNRIAGECLNMHVHLADRLRSAFGLTVYLTIGSVDVLGKEWASFDPAAARSLFERKLSVGEKFVGHGWLTLPSYEIIDATIQTTIGIQQSDDSMIGNIVAQHVSDLTAAFVYHPSVLGEEYIHSINGMQKFRVL